MRKLEGSFDDIAIIGMAGRFPEADTLQIFWDNILSRRDSIRKLPQSRLAELQPIIGSIPSLKLKAGYLEQVTFFEPEIFKISQEEASYLDPQHRLLLELVEEAILDSGYNPEKLTDKSVGVFNAASRNNYSKQAYSGSPMAFISGISSSGAGRIAYKYDFHGPVLTIDTACSSALVALYSACQNLWLGECELAIVGGVEIILHLTDDSQEDGLTFISNSQQIRSFDKAADGTVTGEGGGIVLLKLFNKAIEDRDNIHAIIKGIAVNDDGARSNGIISPSSRGQAEVIKKAVRNAGIDPLTISYFEANGMGTKLGDPVEIEGLQLAFSEFGYQKQVIPLGSVKPNIGHLNSAAGMASLLKTILALKNQTIPPMINYLEANPLINFADSPCFVNTKSQYWKSQSVRRAGISSVGMTGTNGYVILEETARRTSPIGLSQTDQSLTVHTIILSARTEKSLKLMAAELQTYLQNNSELEIKDIAYTLNVGRRNYPNKVVVSAKNREELITKLSQIVVGDRLITEIKPIELRPIFIFPDIEDFQIGQTEQLAKENPLYAYHLDRIKDQITNEAEKMAGKRLEYFCGLSALVETLKIYSLKPQAVLGFGSGDILADLVMDECTEKEALTRLCSHRSEAIDIPLDKVREIFENILKADFNTFYIIFPTSRLAELCARVLTGKKAESLILSEGFGTFDSELTRLIKNGLQIDWDKVYQGQQPYRVSLPTYAFDRKSYLARPERFYTPEVQKPDSD